MPTGDPFKSSFNGNLFALGFIFAGWELISVCYFYFRYAIVSKQTFPHWGGDPRQGIEVIMQQVNMDKAQYQLGKTKIFVKAPESVCFFTSSAEFENNLLCFSENI
jgi:hypothetical protein